MKQILANLYSEYGRHIDSQRAIPSENDCLKPVERRLLVSVHEAAPSGGKLQKSAKVVGYCLGNYHAHGDGCLVGDTKLYSLDNKIFTLKELVDNRISEIESIGFDKENHKIVNVIIKNVRITKKVNELYEIIFYNGTNVKCTNNHPFFCTDIADFKRADELTVGETILNAVKHNKHIWFNSWYLTKITEIKKIQLVEEESVYDFTVDNYENAFIVTSHDKDLNNINLICAHNSNYESLVGLVNRGLVIGQGNWGRRGWEDSSPASMRYTECKEQPIVNEIISELLPYVPREAIELEPEPLYIPSPIPMGLIGDGIITGIGFNITRIGRYSYVDLLKRTYSLLNGKNEPVTIKPNFKDCVVKEVVPGEFEKILTTGEGTVEVIPIIKTLNSNTLVISGIHPLNGFNKLKNFNEKYEEINEIPYFEVVDAWNYKSKTSLEVHISPYKKKVLTEEFVKKIVELVSAKINIKVNVVDEINNTVKQVGIDHILLKSYDKWKLTHKCQFESILKKLKQELYDINIIELIRIVIQKNNTTDINIISKEVVNLNSNITEEEVIGICNKYRIRRLIDSNIDKSEILLNIQKYQDKLNTLNLEVFNIFKIKFLKI